MVFELLDFSTWDPATILATLFGAVGVTPASIQRISGHQVQRVHYPAFIDGNDISSPDQNRQRLSLRHQAETWKMTDDNKDMLWTWLRAKGGVTRADLDAVITQAESG